MIFLGTNLGRVEKLLLWLLAVVGASALRDVGAYESHLQKFSVREGRRSRMASGGEVFVTPCGVDRAREL